MALSHMLPKAQHLPGLPLPLVVFAPGGALDGTGVEVVITALAPWPAGTMIRYIVSLGEARVYDGRPFPLDTSLPRTIVFSVQASCQGHAPTVGTSTVVIPQLLKPTLIHSVDKATIGVSSHGQMEAAVLEAASSMWRLSEATSRVYYTLDGTVPNPGRPGTHRYDAPVSINMQTANELVRLPDTLRAPSPLVRGDWITVASALADLPTPPLTDPG